GCRGLEIVGADLVEVAPAYDTSGNTALTAANLLFEMLCVFPGVEYRTRVSGKTINGDSVEWHLLSRYKVIPMQATGRVDGDCLGDLQISNKL
ncbi:MAG: hypothetical protein GY802_25140, partial [Gammaproteobacteria bacterium]|nr:hypothetical protein [Gammaproteobacteria bacterium]